MDEPTDLDQDMEKLNMLYEELMWDNDDVLDFTPDYKHDRIIITNISQRSRRIKHGKDLDAL